MTRTVTAFGNEELGRLVADTLERNGIPVRYRCATGAEAIRSIEKMGGGILVCAHKLPDMTADALTGILRDIASVLVVAKRQYLDTCRDPRIFRMASPIKPGELTGAVNMLLQIDRRRAEESVPRRSAEDEALIREAKALLMARNGFTEEAAHRFLQRRSMETCSKLAETAKFVISAYGPQAKPQP